MSRGGKRAGSGRKPNAVVNKVRAELDKRQPEAMKAIDAVLADPGHREHAAIAKWLIDKTTPNLKPETAPVKFDLSGDTPADQARSIAQAASNGVLSATVATELLTALAACSKIIEVSEFETAIAEIKAKQEKQNR